MSFFDAPVCDLVAILVDGVVHPKRDSTIRFLAII
jgi:hypothetical protein